GTATNPTIEGSHTTDGQGSGIFASNITGLTPNTMYFLRAYAVNEAGVAYGNEIVITTDAAAPELTTADVTEITMTTAISCGNITYDGDATILERGICWSTTPEPDISDSFVVNGTGAGIFSSNMTGLAPGTRYYVRAYAKNRAGIAYGDEISFNTQIADVEGNLYKTVNIGLQVWMAENLRTVTFNDNTPIPNVTESADWITITTPAYCWIRNDIQYKDSYGALYNWFAVETGKLCPTGWHVPSDDEYSTLELTLGLPADQANLTEWRGTDQGTQMKSTTGWAEGENGTNTSGFSAIPAGYRFAGTGAFNGIDMITYWWSSEYNADYAWYRRVDGTNTAIYRYVTSKRGGKYVRCLKD
ncbi:MAG: fibrobacter succinogenes major paralogous domain-containing protein, partial [Bacteroidales bacterium]|nr:fibrobacter succinogenes major paralogous domain-containing protein [Bacteroidales bacterium]